MQRTYTTSRLLLNWLAPEDSEFIRELVNTAGWLQFIGERNVKSAEEAVKYVEKIRSNHSIKYWVVTGKDTGVRIGIITLIKREDLDAPDIGFAFLPQYSKQGYALEATQAVMHDAEKEYGHIVAITVKENISSISLLEKLGFRFEKEIAREGETLLCYEYAVVP
jgi:ribosomal-protein-alanine N-acetyltransferase